MAVPDYLTKVDGFEHRYVLDPDAVYPQLLDELKAYYAADAPGDGYGDAAGQYNRSHFMGAVTKDQYWLEVVYQCAKLDAQADLKRAGIHSQKSLVIIVRGGEGYKDRWRLENHPEGARYAAIRQKHGLNDAKTIADIKKASLAADKQVALESREHYKALRGMIPV